MDSLNSPLCDICKKNPASGLFGVRTPQGETEQMICNACLIRLVSGQMEIRQPVESGPVSHPG